MSRSARERQEWEISGELASGLERARLALRLSIAAANHEAAEGVGR